MFYFLKKILILFQKIIKKKIEIKLGVPKDIKIIVYNSDSMDQLKYILEDNKFIVLDFRLDQIKEIYFSFKLFLLMISNISRFKLSKNYFVSIIKLVNPKIFITGTGNHTIFYELAKLLDKNTEFMAIQNARRSDFERNDYDYKNWVKEALRFYADTGDMIILISSSGNSENMINASKFLKKKNNKLITFTGFYGKNRLHRYGLLNFIVHSNNYNYIENSHQYWLLALVDLVVNFKN